MLASSKAHTSRFISANLPCNKFKNRLVNIMPYESTRVCLQPIRGVEGSDYINASFIDGYRYLRSAPSAQGSPASRGRRSWTLRRPLGVALSGRESGTVYLRDGRCL